MSSNSETCIHIRNTLLQFMIWSCLILLFLQLLKVALATMLGIWSLILQGKMRDKISITDWDTRIMNSFPDVVVLLNSCSITRKHKPGVWVESIDNIKLVWWSETERIHSVAPSRTREQNRWFMRDMCAVWYISITTSLCSILAVVTELKLKRVDNLL